MKSVAILGCTGSIGTQTLDVIRKNSDKLKVHSLVAFSNAEKLQQCCNEFHPVYSALISVDGEGCLIEAVKGCDIAVIATRGIVAIDAVLYCLEHNIDVALANKEVLVTAGKLVTSVKTNARIIPVDSEHSAIMQCIASSDSKPVRILLTASGGPFYDYTKEQLACVTSFDALQHPNWNMGAKITIDSATMMNKSLEVMEATHLFGVDADNIEIIVHRQSVVHSMVEFEDGTVIAQLAKPDMHLPICYALLGTHDVSCIERLNFEKLKTLTFVDCDFDKFPCAKLGYVALKSYTLMPTVMNAVNDVCVENFVSGRFEYVNFYPTILQVMNYFESEIASLPLTTENIKLYDKLAREYATKLIEGRK